MFYLSARSQLNINHIAVAIVLALVAMADIHAQTCPTVSSDTTVTSSCDTGIALTGNNNLTIGTPTSGPVQVSNPGFDVISASGNGETTINNTGNGSIIGDFGVTGILMSGEFATINNSGTISAANNGYGIANNGAIDTLTNSGVISSGSGGGIGILNEGTITTFTNSGTISSVGLVAINNRGGTITTLTNSGTISGRQGGINNHDGTITTLTNSGTVLGQFGIGNNGTIANLNNTGTISATNGGWGILNGGTISTLTNSGVISSLDPGGRGILNGSGNTITTLTNLGTISTRDGIINGGTISTLTNSGTIDTGIDGIGIINTGTIATLTNSGRILAGDSLGFGGRGIYNDGIINTLTNSGAISVGTAGYGIDNVGTITTLTNSGTISAGNIGFGISNGLAGSIGTLTNSGTITALDGGYGISNTGTINTLTNSGTITADGGYGIDNVGTITTLTNSGTITADGGAGITNEGTIITLTNSGTITVNGGFGAGITNAVTGTIGTLSNAQGGNGSSPSTTALTYSGNLPTKYNVIINSATHYGQLAVTNPGSTPITNFGIYGAPLITTRTYASVLSGTDAPTGIRSGTYDNMRWSLTANGAAFDLVFAGASLVGTQQSLVNTAAALQNTYALQNAVLANSFAYDCPVFGEHNVCVSAGGRNTAVSAANGLNNTSALLIAAYRIKPTLRIGAYADQNLSVNNAGSTVNLGNSTPLIGLFGVWNQRIDGTGTEVKVAAAYGQKNTTVSRQIVGLSEAGTGSSNLNSQGAQITAKYGFAVIPDVLVSPYLGMRYTQNNMGSYTEGASSAVTEPLTYSALNTNATTALAGVGAAYRFIPKATAFASAGVETDTNTSRGTYSATGITGLTPVSFNPNPVKTRPTATLGAYYDIVKNQRIGITGIYRQESYQAISTTTVMATYTIGL